MDRVEDSLVYYVALKKAGVPVEMHLYAQGGHAFGLRRTKLPITAMASVGGDVAGDDRDDFGVGFCALRLSRTKMLTLYTPSMEALKIVVLCLLTGALYGVLHDQVTARVCLEYFTVFHPDIFHTQSPTLLALGWGVLATWWVSLTLGILLAIAARAGSRPRVTAQSLLPKLLSSSSSWGSAR